MALNITFNQTSAPITWEPSVILTYVYPLALLSIGIFIFAFLIFKFYKYLARRDIVKLRLDVNKPMSTKILVYLLNQLVIVPALIFFWFLIMACILLFMSNASAQYIMLVSMATVAAIRITSYYKVSLSEDIAKLMPLTLFSVFILQMDFVSVAGKLDTVKQMLMYSNRLIFYLMFAVAVELIMRVQQIIQDVIEIRHYRINSQAPENQEKKAFDTIINRTFENANNNNLETQNAKIKKENKSKDKRYNDDLTL